MSPSIDKSKLSALAVSFLLIALVYTWFPFSKYLISAKAEPILKVAWAYSEGDDWAHCRIVPLFSLFMIYLRWNEILKIEWKGESIGLPLVLLSGFFFWFGYITDLHYFAYLSFQGMLASLVLWFAGKPMLKALGFPILFLLFMWPWLFLDNLIAFPLRILMSKISHHFLNLVGVSNLQIGSSIVSAPNYLLSIPQGSQFQLDVANPCSGIRSLFALTMFSALGGYLFLPKVKDRMIVFASSIPLAIFGNFTRIIILTFATILFGHQFAIGTEEDPSLFHMGAGYFVYVIAIGGMFGLGWLLQRDWKKWGAKQKKEFIEEELTAPQSELKPPSDQY